MSSLIVSTASHQKTVNGSGCCEPKHMTGRPNVNILCSIPIPLAGRLGNTQTNKPLNRDDWGLSKLLSRRDLETDCYIVLIRSSLSLLIG